LEGREDCGPVVVGGSKWRAEYLTSPRGGRRRKSRGDGAPLGFERETRKKE
jgi:hypothetical protein